MRLKALLLSLFMMACGAPAPQSLPTPVPAQPSSLLVKPDTTIVVKVPYDSTWTIIDSVVTYSHDTTARFYKDSLVVIPGDTVKVPTTADFTWNCDSLTCTFFGTAQHDESNTIVGTRWTLGNGRLVDTTYTFTKTFSPTADPMDLTFTVKDSDGGIASATKHFQVPTFPVDTVTPPPTDTTPTPPDTVTPPPVDTVVPPPVDTSTPPAAGNRPAGLSKIIDIDFGPTALPASWTSAPNAQYGLNLGKAHSLSSAKIIPSPDGYAHRQTFNLSAVTGRGVGGDIFAKENLGGNTDGNSTHSYRIWYETGKFRFGGPNGESGFENMGSDGFKLLGYWGGMCPGNIQATQMIIWAAPTSARVNNKVTLETNWKLQIRWNAGCGATATTWTTVRPGSWPTFTAGPWHTYEILADAGDVGQANGSVTVWIDGVKAAWTTQNLRAGNYTRGWFGRLWDPVLNGVAGLKKTRVDVLDVDHMEVWVGKQID